MRIIEFYILKRIFILFAAVMLACVVIILTVQVLARINFLTTSGQTFFTLLKFSSLLIPSVVFLAMPFALVIAVSITLSIMNQDSELVIVNASGAPRSTVWKPNILLAIIASILSFIIVNFVAPQARLNMREMLATANSDMVTSFIQEGTFRQLDSNLLMQVGERHEDGTIGRLVIVDNRDPVVQLLYSAVNGSILSNERGNYLVLSEGEVQRRDLKTKEISNIKFGSYTFNLSEFTSDNGTPTVYAKDRSLAYLFNPDPNDPIYQRKPLQFTAEFHRRFTEWLYPLVFTFIALAVAGDARSHRQARVSAATTAIILSLFVYWLNYFFVDLAEKDLAYVPMLYIIPIGIIVLLCFMMLTNRQIALPTFINDFIVKRIESFKNKFSSRPSDKISGGGA